MKTPNRRFFRNLLSEPRFQLRFVRFILVGSVIQMTIIAGILYYFLAENYTLLVRYGAIEEPVREILYSELRGMIAAITATFLLYFLMIGFLALVFSHRIAGVIVALKRTIGDLESGKDTRLSLRGDDEFQDLANHFNRLIQQLKSRT